MGGAAGSDAALAGGRVLVTCPELELYVGDRMHLRVLRNLVSGRLMIRPGRGVSTFQFDYARSELAVGMTPVHDSRTWLSTLGTDAPSGSRLWVMLVAVLWGLPSCGALRGT